VNDDERVPITDAVRSLDWMMAQLTAARRDRDTSVDLFRRLDTAMSEYVATTRALLERNPYADATAKREAIPIRKLTLSTRKSLRNNGEREI
jgi:hypothetical protein